MRDLRHDARGVPLLLLTLWCAAATAAVTATTVSSSTTAGREVLLPLMAAASPTTGSVRLTGLRFSACHDKCLRVVLLQQSTVRLETAAAAAQLSAAPSLDFELTHDGSSDSWSLSATLPLGAPQPAAVEVWCRSCRAGGSGQEVTGTVGRQAVQGSGPDAIGMVVLVLEAAVLPGSDGLQPGTASAGATTARRLQAAAPASCELTVGGQVHSFASCTQAVATASHSLTVYTTVVPDGAGSVVRMGMAAKTGGGWAGWAVPLIGRSMIGARAVIMWPTATGAEVAGFQLASYEEADINAAMGTFKISEAAAESDAGQLRAVCTFSLPDKRADALAAAAGFRLIYAMGPMGGRGSPGLGNHAVGRHPFGSKIVVLKKGAAAPAVVPATSSATASPPSASSAGSPAASEGSESPAAAPSSEAGGAESGPAHGHEHAAEGGSSSSAGGDSGCILHLGPGGGSQSFDGCTLITRLKQDVHLMWRTEAVPSNPSKLLLTLGINGTTRDRSGYVSVGFPARARHMSGATAMILQTCGPAGSAGCTDGAKMQQWFLGSTSASDVVLSNGMAITNLQAAAFPATGQLAGSFQLEVDAPATAAGRKLLLLENGDGSMPLIFAAGRVGSDGRPLEHFADAAATLPVLSAAGTAGAAGMQHGGSVSRTWHNTLKAAHAWLGALGWGVLIPVGIVLARSFKEADPLWFHLHWGLQAAGFALGTLSVLAGFALVHWKWEAESPAHAVHRNLGVACTVLGCTQLSALAFRPQKGHRYRFAWELWHHWVGRAAAVLAIANIYYGFLHMWELGAWAWASYTAVLAAIVAVSLGKDAADWYRRRHMWKACPSDAVPGEPADIVLAPLRGAPAQPPQESTAYSFSVSRSSLPS